MYNLRKSPGADTQLDRELQILAHAHKNRTLKDLNLRNVDRYIIRIRKGTLLLT